MQKPKPKPTPVRTVQYECAYDWARLPCTAQCSTK